MKPRKPSRTPEPAPPRSQRARARIAAALATALLCAGCGGGMEGVYANRAGSGLLEFRRDGTVYVTVYGGTYVGEYRVQGERVIVQGPNGAQVYTRAGNRLEGGFGTVFDRLPPGATAPPDAPRAPDPHDASAAPPGAPFTGVADVPARRFHPPAGEPS